MAKAPPSFDFFYNDWLGGTRHLTHEERSVYLELLIYQWQNGHLPTTKRLRMTVVGISDEGYWDEVIWPALADKFLENPLGYSPENPLGYSPENPENPLGFQNDENCTQKRCLVNQKLASQRAKSIARWAKRSENARKNGAKGGRPKKNPAAFKKKPTSGRSISSSLNKKEEDESISRLPEAMQPVLRRWLTYKAEKRQPYKPTGFSAMVTKVAKRCVELGESEVIQRFERSMAENYDGWDYPLRADGQQAYSKPKGFKL